MHHMVTPCACHFKEQPDIQRSHRILQPHQQHIRVLLSSHPCLSSPVFLILAIQVGVKWYTFTALILMSLVTTDIGTLDMCLVTSSVALLWGNIYSRHALLLKVICVFLIEL